MAWVAPVWDSVLVSGDEDTSDEQLGSKSKFWVINPDDNHPWLFKYSRERDGVVRGEDWAEWVVHHVATLMSIPTAEIRPATCGGQRGIVSKSVVVTEKGERLVLGNSLLSENDENYDPTIPRENPRYTVGAVFAALRGIGVPPASNATWGAFDVWTGYVTLDALVAGRDRHHENWGVISSSVDRRLAPSFDHGNALGFQESDESRCRIMSSPEALERWARRGRSHYFADRPDLIDIARRAVARAKPDAAGFWRDRVVDLDLEKVDAILSAVPPDLMSDVTRRFIIELMTLNRRRLLDAYSVA